MLMNLEKTRIAIVRLSALGDIVNTAVILQIIHKHIPNAQIDWYVEEAFASVLEMHPLLNRVIPVPLKKLKKEKSLSGLFSLIRFLRSQNPYDIIIDTQGLLKSALICSFLKGHKHGFDSKSAREGAASWFYDTVSAIPYEENVIRRNVQVVMEGLDIPFDESEISLKLPVFPQQSRPGFLTDTKAIACVIGASWPSKCYPKEQFAQICDHLPYPCYLIWGSHNEYEDAQWIASHSLNAIVAPKMSLKELINFISYCDLIIGNDTGPTHMAWAMNRPSITLFGPTNERMIYPTPINTGIKSPSIVNILKIDRNDFSIRDIPVSSIIQKAKEYF